MVYVLLRELSLLARLGSRYIGTGMQTAQLRSPQERPKACPKRHIHHMQINLNPEILTLAKFLNQFFLFFEPFTFKNC